MTWQDSPPDSALRTGLDARIVLSLRSSLKPRGSLNTRGVFCRAIPPKKIAGEGGSDPHFGGVCRPRRALRTAPGVAPPLARTRRKTLMAFIPRQVKPPARITINCKVPEVLATLLKHYEAFESNQETRHCRDLAGSGKEKEFSTRWNFYDRQSGHQIADAIIRPARRAVRASWPNR